MVGEHKAIELSYNKIQRFLWDFDLTLGPARENRIDYAYHTNYVRNMNNFLDINNINKMQVSNFERGSVEFFLDGDDETDIDYISFGRRKSNNIFLRMYNKTKEVVELGYKQFFIDLWYHHKMISRFDKWLYEKAFLDKSYESILRYRFEFYVEHGTNKQTIEDCKEILADWNKYEKDTLKAMIDSFVPRPTLIMNVEFQTKTKFYSHFPDLRNKLGLQNIVEVPQTGLQDLYLLLDHKVLVHNLLTNDVFRLVDWRADNQRKRNKPITPFWHLIQNCKLPYRTDEKILRQYQRNLDIELIKKRMLRGMTVLSLYQDVENGRAHV